MASEKLIDLIAAVLALLTVVAISGTVSPYDWRRWSRFSLRTLLVVTTLVAVVLGLAVYTFRK
jgi:hypothetical protein